MQDNDISTAIGKRQGTIKLNMTDAIPDISVVEGDAIGSWHICITRPYRTTHFSKELTSGEALSKLRAARARYKRMMNQVEKEIQWITGEEYDG